MLLDKEIEISPAEFQVWKDMPTTKAVFDLLSQERSLEVERMVNGDTLVPGQEIKETAGSVGYIKGLGFFLEGVEIEITTQWEEAKRRKEEEVEENEN